LHYIFLKYTFFRFEQAIAPRPIGKSDWDSLSSASPNNDNINQDNHQSKNSQLKSSTVGENGIKIEEQTKGRQMTRRHCRWQPPALVVGLALGVLCAGIMLGIVLGLKYTQNKEQNKSSSISY